MSFTIYTGPMFGGKTSKMLADLEREKYRKKKIILFKPEKDKRYSHSQVKTHAGNSWPAVNVANGEELIQKSKGYDIIGVDEAFMIEGCGDALVYLFSRGYTIYVSTIQLSSEGKAFYEPMVMFPYATKIEICPAVCPVNGDDAFYTMAIGEKSDEIHVGGSEVYEPRCFDEYSHILRKREYSEKDLESILKCLDSDIEPNENLKLAFNFYKSKNL